MMLTKAEIQVRNIEINQAFGAMYQDGMKKFGKVYFTQIYFALGKQFNLSSMQVRRVVRGYTN